MSSYPKDLFDAATQARQNSYSPYSHCKVGAAIRTESGKIFSGCNVENSSYSATICAERVAITNAVSELGAVKIVETLVVTDASPPWPPCGICRQSIAEFGPESVIHSANLQGESRSQTIRQLFPDAFTPSHLKV